MLSDFGFIHLFNMSSSVSYFLSIVFCKTWQPSLLVEFIMTTELQVD